jgi:hypothetical protein
MSKPILCLLLLSVSWIAEKEALSFAQTNPHAARKFDEFGDVQTSDLMARLDNFAIQLQNEPTVKGFILVYRGRRDLPGLSNRYAMRSKGYLINSRGFPKERVIAVDGGEADCLTQEFWIVPPGTTPVPRSDAYARDFADLDSARKIDEFGYEVTEASRRGNSSEYPTEADLLETFATELRREKRALAYLVAYAHFSPKRQLVGGDNHEVSYEPRIDPPDTSRKRLRFESNLLVKVYGIAPSRIRLIDGGYRKWRGVEFWLVPRGEHAPIPTPNSYPPKRAQSRK